MCAPFAKYGHQTCLTYFNLTQLLLLADHDVMYAIYRSVTGNVTGQRLGWHQCHVFTRLRVWFNQFSRSGMA